MPDETALPPSWFATLAATSLDPLFVLEPIRDAGGFDVVCRYANDAAGGLFGLVPADMLGRRLTEMVRPIHGLFRTDLAEVVMTGEARQREIATLPENVNAERLEYRIVPVEGMLAVSIIDRTGEDEARSDATLARALMEAGSASSFAGCAVLRPLRDADGTIVDVVFEHANAEIGRLLGRTLDEVVGRPFYGEVYSGLGRLIPLARECEATGAVVELIADTRAQALAADELEIRLVQTGELIVAHFADVSLRRSLIGRVVASESRFRTIFETATEGVVLVDAEGVIQFANPAFESMMRVSVATGQPLQRFADPIERGWTLREALAIRAGERVGVRHRILSRRGDATRFWVEVTTDVVLGIHGEVLWFVVFVTDVDEAVQSERTIAALADAVADTERRERERIADELHDGPVQELAVASLRLGAELQRELVNRDALEVVDEALRSASRDLRGLLTRLAPPEIDPEDPVRSVRERVAAVLEHASIASSVTGEVRQRVHADVVGLLVQLAQEAAVNAHKHAGAQHLDLAIHTDSGRIIMTITDDGIGPSVDVFAPRAGHRGLPSLRDRVHAVGGDLTAVHAPGGGLLLRVELPQLVTER